MNQEQRDAFYGVSRPTVRECMAKLLTATGSESCARELIEAADFVELACVGRAFSHMPEMVS